MGEELRRRIRLERPPARARASTCARPLAEVAHRVAHERLRRIGRAGAERGDVEGEIADAPVRRRHRQVAVAQRVADARVGPAQRRCPSTTRNGSSAPTPGTGSSTPSSLSSDAMRPPSTPKHGPVRLLRRGTRAGTRRAAPAFASAAKKALASRRPQLELGQRDDLAAARRRDAHRSALRESGSQCVLHVAARALDVAHVAPALAVVGELRCRSATRPRRPRQRSATRVELARLVGRGACPGSRRELEVDRSRRCPCRRRCPRRSRARPMRVRRSARSAVGPPGEFDLALAKPQRLPVARKAVTRVVAPHQTLSPLASTSFNCSAFGGASPRTSQRELVARRKVDRQRALRALT